MARTLSAKQVLTIKFDTIRLGGGWDECVGEIETTGIWFIWGNSGNGKTSAVVSLCKELSAFGKVLYNSREEGVSLTMQNTLRRYGMGELGADFSWRIVCYRSWMKKFCSSVLRSCRPRLIPVHGTDV